MVLDHFVQKRIFIWKNYWLCYLMVIVELIKKFVKKNWHKIHTAFESTINEPNNNEQ